MITDLLDQIDMLDGELLPDWKYNDRTGAVIANAYRKQGDKWSCLVAKGIPADRDGEFIALARTALPKLAKALHAVMDLEDESLDGDLQGYEIDQYVGHNQALRSVREAITDALGTDDD